MSELVKQAPQAYPDNPGPIHRPDGSYVTYDRPAAGTHRSRGSLDSQEISRLHLSGAQTIELISPETEG